MTSATSYLDASTASTQQHVQDAHPPKTFQPIASSAITIPAKRHICQKEHLKLNTNSPKPNGTYDSDRVIKSGEIRKRTKKTKSWKPVYVVLRPNILSIYKDRENTKLRHQVRLYDLTAVARQRDPKHRVKHVFGLFSPSRNFHLSANSEEEAQSWVEAIRREARMDEEDEEMILMSPTATKERAAPFGIKDHASTASSSEDPDSASPRHTHRERGVTVDSQHMHSTRRPSTTMQNYSGNEAGSYSDFSDPGFLGSVTSFTTPGTHSVSAPAGGENTAESSAPKRPTTKRNNSHISLQGGGGGGASSPPEDRVVCQGWVQLLKSHHGVHQWRSVWAVLRPKTFATYKNEEEYSAQLVIPFSNLVDAVEIDPLSKTKHECFQLIAEERTYRLCAASEGDLDRWLGAFKSLLAKRKESQIKAGGGAAAVTAVAALSLDSSNIAAPGEQMYASSNGQQSSQR